MKLVKKVEVEVEGDKLRIENVSIAEEKYDIEIMNYNHDFSIRFLKDSLQVFAIRITDEGDLRIERRIRRVGCDHDDHEFFCGADMWVKSISSALKIPFGMRSSIVPNTYGY